MKNNFKYKIGYNFFLTRDGDNFNKATIIDRDIYSYENSKPITWYKIKIDYEMPATQWVTENFIDKCAYSEQEVKDIEKVVNYGK